MRIMNAIEILEIAAVLRQVANQLSDDDAGLRLPADEVLALIAARLDEAGLAKAGAHPHAEGRNPAPERAGGRSHPRCGINALSPTYHNVQSAAAGGPSFHFLSERAR